MMCNNPYLDLVNINAYTKFGKILLFCSQDIELKQNSEWNEKSCLNETVLLSTLSLKLWIRKYKHFLFKICVYFYNTW